MRLRISLAVFTLMALALLAIARGFATPDPPAAPKASLKELVALHRLAAHDAAVHRNAAAKARCDAGHAQPRSFAALFGSEAATPGPAFGKLQIDAISANPPDGPFRIATTERSRDALMIEAHATVADGRPPYCEPKDDPEIYCPFECRDRAEVDCWNITEDLTEAWGKVEHAAWRDRSGHVRALVYYGDNICTLQFTRYVPPHAWIAETATAEVPLALLGAPTSRLPEGARSWAVDDDEIDYEWDVGVTGDRMLAASLLVHARHGRIVELEVRGTFLVDGGADEVHELVRPYRGRFAVTLSTDANGFGLEISAASRVQ